MKVIAPATIAVIVALAASNAAGTTLIRNVAIVDGSGGEAFPGSVRIDEDRIVDVGQLTPQASDQIVDGHGMVLAPGFIDTHSHHDEKIETDRRATAVVSQGITTIVIGQDGISHYPLKAYFSKLQETPVAVNVASYVGHGTLREAVLGTDIARTATAEEVSRMGALLEEDMDAGGLGLSTGLEYDPGIYASTQELIDLAKVAAEANGRLVSHIRSEDRHFWAAIDEVITIGREARIPVQISHLKLAMKSLWNSTDRLLGILEAARKEGLDITADVYPYTYWQSTMTVLFPERDFDNRATALFAVNELAPAEGMILARFDARPEYVGKTLTEVAELNGMDPADTLIHLIALSSEHLRLHGERGESIIATSMHEDDVKRLLSWEHTNLGSDGYLKEMHPRGRGAFPRFLGRYVREDRLMKLETAVHKMTALAARHMGFEERGMIKKGMIADLVLFDSREIIDNATTEDPFALSSGVKKVFVNGVLVFDEGRSTDALPGKVIRKS